VLLSGQTVHVNTGAAFDLNKLIGYGDDYDPHPTLTCEGGVDTNTPGSYAVTAVITDFAGNVTRSNITVNVSGSSPGTSSRPVESFEDFKAMHPGSRYGVDVSKWQGSIDFNAVREAGADFVLMRIGFGNCELDPCFVQNIDGAFEAGLSKGVYFYSTANNPETARSQADWIVGTLNGTQLDMPVAFDWESFSHFQDYGMSFQDLNACYDAFAARLAESGYQTMLYSSLNPLRHVWYTGGRTVWLAHYTSEQTSYEGGYYIWQASNTGRIAGIDGDVDMNVMP
jgi:GH25 family lysozyme M1 (1,4-beta-N-acetylmuramidase)